MINDKMNNLKRLLNMEKDSVSYQQSFLYTQINLLLDEECMQKYHRWVNRNNFG